MKLSKSVSIIFILVGLFFCGCETRKEEKVSFFIPGKVLICGVGRDIQKSFSFTKQNIEAIGSLFDDYRVFIYENNSIDESSKLLSDWRNENPRVSVISEVVNDEILSESCFVRTAQGDYSRPERIARARNIVLDQIMQEAYSDFAYVVWMDLDFEEIFDLTEFKDVFAKVDKWDAVFANGVDRFGHYFDGFSLRDKVLPLGPELIGDRWWKLRSKIGRLKLGPRSRWYPVYSAFGGLGIYKKEAIQGCRYSATVTPDLEMFLRALVKQGVAEEHFEVKIYEEKLKRLKEVISIPQLVHDLYRYDHTKDEMGFILGQGDDKLVFLMNSGIGQYPSVCEHVPFHASMILRGFDRLYIHPKLVLHYEERGDPPKKKLFKFRPIKYIKRQLEKRKELKELRDALV